MADPAAPPPPGGVPPAPAPAPAAPPPPDPLSQAAQLQAAEAIRLQMEEYVCGRIRQFAREFAREIAPGLPPEAVDDVTGRVLGSSEPAALMLPPAPPAVQPGQGQYRLEFRHECTALGCRDTECTLCCFNPVRVCERNFQKKYLVADPLRAKCGACVRLELVDLQGEPVTAGYPDLVLELTLLDGVAFKDRGGEARLLSDTELSGCFKLSNHKDEPLLQYKAAAGGSGGAKGARHSIQIRLENGVAVLPDLTVTDSSEALLQGRRPPFRLLAWCPDGLGGFNHAVQYAVSDDFVVATRRVKQANKADIPLVDEHVSKIEHIGRETVKKLSDMRLAAQETGVDIHIDDRLARIQTVGDFQNLVRCVDADGGQLRKAIQAVLKLSKEKWDEAAKHAMEAVHPDFRRRVWYPPGQSMGVGLVFNCRDGAVQLRDRISLAQAGPDGAIKVMVEDQLDPASLEILRDLKVTAVKKWSEPRHPGWGIFTEPPGAGAPPPGGAAALLPTPGLICLGPGAAGAAPGRAAAKRSASAAGLDRAASGKGGGGGGDLAAAAAAAAAAGLAGWPLAAGLAPLAPEALAALTAQLGAAGGAPPLVPGGAAGDPAVMAAAAALAGAPPFAGALPLAGGAGGGAGAAGALDPSLLLALQAQLAAGGGALPLPLPLPLAPPGAGEHAAGAAAGAWAAAGAGGGGSGGDGGLGELAALCPPPSGVLPHQLGAAADAAAAAGLPQGVTELAPEQQQQQQQQQQPDAEAQGQQHGGGGDAAGPAGDAHMSETPPADGAAA